MKNGRKAKSQPKHKRSQKIFQHLRPLALSWCMRISKETFVSVKCIWGWLRSGDQTTLCTHFASKINSEFKMVSEGAHWRSSTCFRVTTGQSLPESSWRRGPSLAIRRGSLGAWGEHVGWTCALGAEPACNKKPRIGVPKVPWISKVDVLWTANRSCLCGCT